MQLQGGGGVACFLCMRALPYLTLLHPTPHRTTPRRTAPHRPHRTAPHHTALHYTTRCLPSYLPTHPPTKHPTCLPPTTPLPTQEAKESDNKVLGHGAQLRFLPPLTVTVITTSDVGESKDGAMTVSSGRRCDF